MNFQVIFFFCAWKLRMYTAKIAMRNAKAKHYISTEKTSAGFSGQLKSSKSPRREPGN